MRRMVLWATVAVAGFVVGAAPRFERVPQQANEMLKGARSKTISSGLVFANGHYLKPSYRIARYGTAIFVNDVQITGQIVAWQAFLATQDGYVAPAPRPAEPAPAKKPAAKAEDDDPFDVGSAPAPAAEPAESEKKDPVAAEERGSFVANEKSAKLLRKIDDYRIDVRRRLREGYICFYGSRYPRVLVEPRIARRLLEVLPEAIRDANDGASLAAKLRTLGYPFMNRQLCDDLIENRADYLEITKRREQIKDDERLGLNK